MSRVTTLSDIAPAEPSASPKLKLFPTTTDLASSPFNDCQSGFSRTIMPTFKTKQDERQYRKENLVLTFRALATQGLAEGIAGHCSTRDPIEPNTFWVNSQGHSFAQMRVSDLVRVHENGYVVEGDAPVDSSATSIHAPIYKQQGRGPGQEGGTTEGVEALVHVHGPHSKAFSCLGRQLDRLNQDVCTFDNSVALIPFGGAVFDLQEGTRIASYLKGDTKVALLQNHGPLSVGKMSILEAAWWQISYEMCCKAQLLVEAAIHRGPNGELPSYVLRVDDEACKSTQQEMGSPEMGWFSMGPYVEDEIRRSKGEHLL